MNKLLLFPYAALKTKEKLEESREKLKKLSYDDAMNMYHEFDIPEFAEKNGYDIWLKIGTNPIDGVFLYMELTDSFSPSKWPVTWFDPEHEWNRENFEASKKETLNIIELSILELENRLD
jgi:hypothetical protein